MSARVIERLVASLREELGSNLSAVWLYGSRARGKRTHPDSDVDLLVIAEGDVERNQRLAGNLGEAAALAEGESPFAYSVHVYDPARCGRAFLHTDAKMHACARR